MANSKPFGEGFLLLQGYVERAYDIWQASFLLGDIVSSKHLQCMSLMSLSLVTSFLP